MAETALQSLRHDVADEFQTNLHQVVDKVLRANAQDIERHGIKVQVGQMAQAAGGDSAAPEGPLVCRMDPFEMEFILDNLVGNAIRAMDSADTRRLNLTWQTTNGMVKMQIKDTGLGIARRRSGHHHGDGFLHQGEGRNGAAEVPAPAAKIRGTAFHRRELTGPGHHLSTFAAEGRNEMRNTATSLLLIWMLAMPAASFVQRGAHRRPQRG